MEVQSNNQGGVVEIQRKPKEPAPPAPAASAPPMTAAPATGPSPEELEAMAAARRAQLQSQQRINQLEGKVQDLNDEIARLKAQQQAAPATQPANK